MTFADRFKILRQCFHKKIKARGKKQQADEEQKNLILFHTHLAVLEEYMTATERDERDEEEEEKKEKKVDAIGFCHPVDDSDTAA